MSDMVETAFELGRTAFHEKAKPLDNPYFADSDADELFNAWSDGWHTSRDASLPVEKRMLTELLEPRGDKPSWWKRNDLRGITATWSVKKANG